MANYYGEFEYDEKEEAKLPSIPKDYLTKVSWWSISERVDRIISVTFENNNFGPMYFAKLTRK